MKIHTTIGLYPNGDYVINGVLPEDLESHIDYNKRYRYGRALLLDGECIYKGTLSNEQIDIFERRIVDENIKMDKCTRPYV